MTMLSPNLRLRRMAVYRNGSPVYDEQFHDGINIIRGENGSGKSTIAEFIYFALGGDFTKWKEYAELCDSVMAELSINSAPITVRRSVSQSRSRPMGIFWGNMEDAASSAAEGWQIFPYARSKSKESFSQTLFRSFGLPPIHGDFGSIITMHQILRLMYVDQTTSFDRLFGFEQFDSALTRQAVGDYLTGIFDNDLYNDELELNNLESIFKTVNSQLRSIFSVLGGANQDISDEFVNSEIEQRRADREKTYEQLSELVEGSWNDTSLDPAGARESKTLSSRLGKINREIDELESRVSDIDYEVSDSRHFIQQIKESLEALEDSSTVVAHFGVAEFSFCPACFSKLDRSVDTSRCYLCSSELDDGRVASHNLRLRHELTQQAEESERLQAGRVVERERLLAWLSDLTLEQEAVQRRYEDLRKGSLSAMEERYAELNRQIGYFDREIEDLQRRLKLAQRIAALTSEKAEIAAQMSTLRDKIEARRQGQTERKAKAYTRVSDITAEILKSDLEREEVFTDCEGIEFSFADNEISVDGHRTFSASSMVYLKNAFHLAIHISSLKEEFFRYPRFTLMDNIEDKGMEQTRSHNFQHQIINQCASHSNAHQIIFTTSMISPDLNIPEYTVGKYYTHENKSLDIT